MNSRNRQHHDFPLTTRRVAISLLLALLIAPVPARAQNPFNSGSTGVDSAFNPAPTPAVQEVQVPESGVFNYTTYSIPAGVTIRYRRNTKNTPVVILTTGDVTILGRIDVSGGNGSLAVFGAASPNGAGLGGPGGFNGGRGGFSFVPFFSGAAGEGPGGGSPGNCGGGGGFAFNGTNASNGVGGQRYGNRSLLPLIGGSGGGGTDGNNGNNGGGGGGGGGAVLIASSGTIRFGAAQARGEIIAVGGNGIANSGGGSGGAIKLIANTITGRALFEVQGGNSPCSGRNTGHGHIRIEAFSYTGFDAQATPQNTNDNPSQPIISLAPPTSVNLPNAPQLTIASVGGMNVPPMPQGSFGAPPDITLPATLPNPVTVALQAANIPVGTLVKITVIPEAGARTTVDSSPLAGTLGSSTATANVNLPATGTSIITAIASFELPRVAQAAPWLIDGERVRRVEVAAAFGSHATVTYITESGKRISRRTE